MKINYLLGILVMLLIISCQQSEVMPEQSSLPTSGTSTAETTKKSNDKLQTLIRIWSEWVSSRYFSVAPFNDPTGDLPYLNQPCESGVFMSAGGASPEKVSRTVSISLSE